MADTAQRPVELKPIEKSCFSSCGAEDFVSQLTGRNVKQVLVCGSEAHICVRIPDDPVF